MEKFFQQFESPPRLRHLKRLTTDFGLMQHSKYANPDPEHGYSIDDNARGLIDVLKYYQLYGAGSRGSVLKLADKYLSYIEHAYVMDYGYHNFANYEKKFIDEECSEDALGRVFWALGFCVYCNIEPLSSRARVLVYQTTGLLEKIKSVRSKAFILLGYYYLNDHEHVSNLANSLIEDYHKHKQRNWHYPGPILTYSNAVIPLALAHAYFLTGKKKYLDSSLKILNFLLKVCRVDGYPAPIGQAGWYKKGDDKAVFDQQPVDAAKTAIAALCAYLATKNSYYLKEAKDWFNWFHGNNVKNVEMIPKNSQGVYDAVTPHGVNRNQGAESIIIYLLMYLDFAKFVKNKSEKDKTHWLW